MGLRMSNFNKFSLKEDGRIMSSKHLEEGKRKIETDLGILT
jgi:hypothetical protein